MSDKLTKHKTRQLIEDAQDALEQADKKIEKLANYLREFMGANGDDFANATYGFIELANHNKDALDCALEQLWFLTVREFDRYRKNDE